MLVVDELNRETEMKESRSQNTDIEATYNTADLCYHTKTGLQ
jgi:hypothetical protein